jgi:hypothetical protein
MAINFLPNDPRAATQMPMRKQTPRKRPPGRARLSFLPSPAPAETPAQPGTPAFLFWQCREAVLAALEMWEQIDGPVKKWAKIQTLKVKVDAGKDLNAYYDRKALLFYHFPVGSSMVFSGASTDAASHECGHALLDSIRPDLWHSNYTEISAFHEGFADCVALLTVLNDKPTRVKLLKVTKDLSKPSFVEAMAEDVAAAVKVVRGPSHPSAEPRHALNKFKWALPENLPEVAPPKVLCSEIHSFARVFVGCFYDVVRLIFAEQPSRTEAGLWKAAEIAMKLLIEGARNAPYDPRFYRAVGRAMLLADDAQNGGKFKPQIHKAFALHGVALGAPAAIAAVATLAGAAPSWKGKAKSKSLVAAAATVRDIRARIGDKSGYKFATRSLRMGEGHVSELVYPKRVRLDSLGSQLKGVFAVGHLSTLVGSDNKQAALIGNPMPQSVADAEVRSFVRSLVKFNRLQCAKTTERVTREKKAGGKKAMGKRAVAKRAKGEEHGMRLPTHRIVARGTMKTVERLRFACGCGL